MLPHDPGSTTIEAAAASAVDRNGAGDAHQLAQGGLELWTGGRRRASDGEQGACLGGGEPGQVGTRAAQQLPSAAAPPRGVHGNSGHAKGIQVPAGRSLGHLELGGDLGGGHPTASL